MPSVIFATIQAVDCEQRRIIVGATELFVREDIPLSDLRPGLRVKVITDQRDGRSWVTGIEPDQT